MINQEISIESIDKLPKAVEAILQAAEGKKIFAFYGEMGSGKTTIIKEICRHLGASDNFSSPSYSIVNEYLLPTSDLRIYHIDLYRLKNIQEAVAAGMEEYLNSNNYCFIEWPELIEPLLSDDAVKISIVSTENTRNVSIFIA